MCSSDLLIGPVISYRSDRHRGRWGRRIPYLMLTAPLTAVTMFALAYSPVMGAWLHQQLGWDAASRGALIQTSNNSRRKTMRLIVCNFRCHSA